MDDHLEKLGEYIKSLNSEERAKHEAKLKNSTIFDLIKQGDTVSVVITIQNGADITQQNEQGMTPLHVASAHNTELIAEILMQEANGAVWERDDFDRLPLDVARENGHHELGNKLEQITYPELFKDEQENQELIEKHLEKQKQSIGFINTAPSCLSQFKTHDRER